MQLVKCVCLWSDGSAFVTSLHFCWNAFGDCECGCGLSNTIFTSWVLLTRCGKTKRRKTFCCGFPKVLYWWETFLLTQQHWVTDLFQSLCCKTLLPLVRVAMWIADCPWKLKILLTLTLLNLSCLHLPCNLPPYTPVHYLSLSTALIFFEVLWHWAPLGYGIWHMIRSVEDTPLGHLVLQCQEVLLQILNGMWPGRVYSVKILSNNSCF